MQDQGSPFASPAASSDHASSTPSHAKEYPLPSATYEGVAANEAVFMETLERLHKSMGTKFMVPIMGGKALDLHRLFVEVTSRGGLEKVIRDRKWRDVIAVFNFPITITNASFVLRRYYISLLHHYEQVYFFRTQGCPVASAAQNPAALLGTAQVRSTTPRKERRIEKASPVLSPNHTVKGVIDGKFEYGYLVTVSIGSEKLRGVLYHSPVDMESAHSYQINGASTSHTDQHHGRKRNRSRTKDPTRPKLKRSGYNFFFAEQYARLKPSYSAKDTAISQKIGLLWSKLTEEEKAVW
ncbi:High mobility group B protein 15 [Nymphaea thermarum]|nr:High mobility group B protein 15 [Nymphaea thermarum]